MPMLLMPMLLPLPLLLLPMPALPCRQFNKSISSAVRLCHSWQPNHVNRLSEASISGANSAQAGQNSARRLASSA